MGRCNNYGWCNVMGWTASTTKWDGWCNIGILVQRNGMVSQHGEMGWMMQHQNTGATRWDRQLAKGNGMEGATE